MMGVTFGEPCAAGHDPFAVNGGAMSIYPNWFPPSRLGQRARAGVRRGADHVVVLSVRPVAQINKG